jgi:hypothetical protein
METRRSRALSWTRTQTQYRREPVEEFEKFRENANMVASLLRRDTPVQIAGEWSREAFFNLSGGVLYSDGESHSLVFLCVPRERACGHSEVLEAKLAYRGVPGRCCYLGVPVPVVSCPYMLALLHVPYPYWVGIFIGYPTRIG